MNIKNLIQDAIYEAWPSVNAEAKAAAAHIAKSLGKASNADLVCPKTQAEAARNRHHGYMMSRPYYVERYNTACAYVQKNLLEVLL